MLQREHRTDREITDFTCKGHEFCVFSAEEEKKIRSAGLEIDSDTGRITPFFLQHLLNKYKHSAGIILSADGNGEYDSGEKATNVFESTLHDEPAHEPVARKHSGGQGPSRVRESLKVSTTSAELSTQRSSTVYAVPGSMGHALGFASSAEDRKAHQIPRRAHTMPPSFFESKGAWTQKIDVEMKNANAVAAVHNQTDAEDQDTDPSPLSSARQESTVKRTVAFATIREDNGPQKQSVGLFGSPSETEAFASNAPATVEDDPTIIMLSPVSESIDNADPSESVDNNRSFQSSPSSVTVAFEQSADSFNGILDHAETRQRYMLTHNGYEDDAKLTEWVDALNVTEAMIPGFIDDHFRVKQEQRDEREGLEDDGEDSRGGEQPDRSGVSVNNIDEDGSDDDNEDQNVDDLDDDNEWWNQ